MANEIINREWRSENGISRRPWVPSDHLSDLVIENKEIYNIANKQAIYVPPASSVAYLKGKKSEGAIIDPVKHPYGYWFNSITLRNITVDGVKRTDGQAHTDGIYMCDDPSDLTAWIEKILIENYTLKNTDTSCMPFLIQEQFRCKLFHIKNLHFENVGQQRLVFKPGVKIFTLRIENVSQRLAINAPIINSGGFISRLEIINSPLVDFKELINIGTHIFTQADDTPPTPLPTPAPVVTPITLEDLDRRVKILEQLLLNK